MKWRRFIKAPPGIPEEEEIEAEKKFRENPIQILLTKNNLWICGLNFL